MLLNTDLVWEYTLNVDLFALITVSGTSLMLCITTKA